MPGRRRQKRTEQSKLDATPPWETRLRAEPDATTGPFDERDHPEDDVERIDFGALRVPTGEYEVRLELDEQQQVSGVSLVGAEGSMQLGVFAAPRNEGIWDEVRAEIAESLGQVKGAGATDHDGPFGVELRGLAPADEGAVVPVRFLGIDGPRWFLRALIAGPVAADDGKAEPFEEAFRQLVVARGPDPLPVREPVALRLPEGVELPPTA